MAGTDLTRTLAVIVVAAEWFIAAGGVAVTIAVWAQFVTRRASGEPAPPRGQTRQIRVDGGYRPSEVHIRANEPARLIFCREETAPCSEHVVFPAFGISATLPPFQDVVVDLPASEPGVHEFTCQMQMLRGTLVVDREVVNP